MRNMVTNYISLARLSRELKLPKAYLLDLADSGKIPCLRVNERYRFDVHQVTESLFCLAREGAGK